MKYLLKYELATLFPYFSMLPPPPLQRLASEKVTAVFSDFTHDKVSICIHIIPSRFSLCIPAGQHTDLSFKGQKMIQNTGSWAV